jgi:hypothetical protein
MVKKIRDQEKYWSRIWTPIYQPVTTGGSFVRQTEWAITVSYSFTIRSVVINLSASEQMAK